MRLNKWLALLLAALLCGVLNGALAEADVALDGIAPEAASLEVAPLEEEALDALTVPDCCRSFLYGNSHGNSHSDHRIVACSDETHHLYVGRYRGGTRELSVRVHASHSVCHAV